MKKVFVSICIASALFSLSSCRSAKEVTSLSSMNGEWSIIEINGADVVPAQGGNAPFIGFNTAEGKVYGNSGCNRMMGSFDINAEAGSMDLGKMAGTRMMCPDMTLEQNVLNALSQVKEYKKMGKELMALCNAENRPVIVLQKKVADVQITALRGSWNITKVNGTAVPADMEKVPFLEFDLAKKSVHGNAGCNIINGGFQTKEDNACAISFPALITTMMACPDMDTEATILKALNEVKTFNVLSDGGIGLYDAKGTLVLTLAKK